MSTTSPSRHIPEAIKREVRQRCGFGCAICGLPIYEYEHMEGWAETQRHLPAEITLLCDRHHKERTNGLLSIAQVRAVDADPFNRRVGQSSEYALHFSGGNCMVLMGSNLLTTRFSEDSDSLTILAIDDQEIIGFHRVDDQLLLNMSIYDNANELVLQIVDSQLIYSVNPWDITFVGRTLTIREGRGQFLLEVTFDPPNKVTIGRSRLVYNGVEIVSTPDYLLFVNNRLLWRGSTFAGGRCAIAVDCPSAVGVVASVTSPRVALDSLGADRTREAMKWAQAQVRTSNAGAPPPSPPPPVRITRPVQAPLGTITRDAVARWRANQQ